MEKDKPEDIEMKEAGSGGEGQHAEPNPAEGEVTRLAYLSLVLTVDRHSPSRYA